MRRFRFGRPTPAMVVAVIALFVALGGTGYAAFKLPPHSVGKKELKRNAVTTAKIDNGTLRLKDFYRRDLNRLLRRAAAGGEEFDEFEDFEDFEDPVGDSDGDDAGDGAALLTGGAGDLPTPGTVRAALTEHDNASTNTAQVATLSPDRDLALSDLSASLLNTVPAGGSVTFEVVAAPAPPFDDPGGNVVIGCSVGPGSRTCTAPGPGTVPANRLVFMRITVSGGGFAANGQGYWGVSVEP
jgi:hypothetical protein